MIYPILFYILGAVILTSTAIAVTRRNLVHAVLYLVISFFGSAMLLYLLGAPFLAAMEVIIYAGAIMVLFLFIIMMINLDHLPEHLFPVNQLVPALIMAAVYAAGAAAMITTDGDAGVELLPAMAGPADFGRYVLQKDWLMIEVVSLLLLVALVGALHLGRRPPSSEAENGQDEESGATA